MLFITKDNSKNNSKKQFATIQNHAKLCPANANIQADKQFYISNGILNSYDT